MRGIEESPPTNAPLVRRLGLLQKNEELTRDKYVSCVQAAAETLRREGFFSDKTAADYVERAKKIELRPRATASQ